MLFTNSQRNAIDVEKKLGCARDTNAAGITVFSLTLLMLRRFNKKWV